MKKLISLLLVLAMVLSLAACGGSSKSAEEAPAAEVQEGAAEEGAAAAPADHTCRLSAQLSPRPRAISLLRGSPFLSVQGFPLFAF